MKRFFLLLIGCTNMLHQYGTSADSDIDGGRTDGLVG